MKKYFNLLKNVLGFLSLMLVVLSCSKTNQLEPVNIGIHKIEPVNDVSKQNSFFLETRLGHSAEGCMGCVMVEGQRIHVDCQGIGDACVINSQVSVSQIGNSFFLTFQDSNDLTGGDFFMMPARSLYAGKDDKKADIWLNIPEQLAYRDAETQLFTFTGIFYTDYQYYENL